MQSIDQSNCIHSFFTSLSSMSTIQLLFTTDFLMIYKNGQQAKGKEHLAKKIRD